MPKISGLIEQYIYYDCLNDEVKNVLSKLEHEIPDDDYSRTQVALLVETTQYEGCTEEDLHSIVAAWATECGSDGEIPAVEDENTERIENMNYLEDTPFGDSLRPIRTGPDGRRYLLPNSEQIRKGKYWDPYRNYAHFKKQIEEDPPTQAKVKDALDNTREGKRIFISCSYKSDEIKKAIDYLQNHFNQERSDVCFVALNDKVDGLDQDRIDEILLSETDYFILIADNSGVGAKTIEEVKDFLDIEKHIKGWWRIWLGNASQ